MQIAPVKQYGRKSLIISLSLHHSLLWIPKKTISILLELWIPDILRQKKEKNMTSVTVTYIYFESRDQFIYLFWAIQCTSNHK